MKDRYYPLEGQYEVTLGDNSKWKAELPGSLDENAIGYPDDHAIKWHPDDDLAKENSENVLLSKKGIITSRYTRKYTYVGKAFYEKKFTFEGIADRERYFIEVERSRFLRCILNDTELSLFSGGTLSAPYVFEATGHLKKENTICFICDNSYEGGPVASIEYSSAATDETQTNWNGLLGYIRIRREGITAPLYVNVYPDKGDRLRAVLRLDSKEDVNETILIRSDAGKTEAKVCCDLKKGRNRIEINDIKPGCDIGKWDEYEGKLFDISISGDTLYEISFMTGLRYFCTDIGETVNRPFDTSGREITETSADIPKGRHLKLNGHRIFLRSETNCAVWPETGYPPMDESEWDEIMKTYASYGVNCVRFHSHCPPEAAFSAADRAGILIHCELSNWDPYTAFGREEDRIYYKRELEAVILQYGNHPSFVMLCLGNELHYSEEVSDYVDSLLDHARDIDATRLYANAANAFYGAKGTHEKSDFHTSSFYLDEDLRGTSSGMRGPVNNEYPSVERNFDRILKRIRDDGWEKPVFAFEVGQYEVLPDLHELEYFNGVTKPANLSSIAELARERGVAHNWDERVKASGELALICYREEMEAVLRTEDYSGLSILGLQDFPGQGTAMIGMLNSHMREKPYPFARPERFKSFFNGVRPFIKMKKYVWTDDEEIEFKIYMANYSRKRINDEVCAKLYNKEDILYEDSFEAGPFSEGSVTFAGSVSIRPKELQTVFPLSAELRIEVGQYSASYPLWIFMKEMTEKKGEVILSRDAEEALSLLKEGKKVLFDPPALKEHFPNGAGCFFSTDHWSVGTYTYQEGYMGILTDPEHPVFKYFPTSFHSDRQWFGITTGSRSFRLPKGKAPLITAIDCYARLRNLGILAEFKVFGGKLMISGMALNDKKEYPEAVSLLSGIYEYMNSEEFDPGDTLNEEEIMSVIS
ncbi:MAG: hypothetical protein K6B28_13105 [Lachnospiraceae bacterium]|nr:hypothetical protein [Lachnospiraceae bacterium]